ncbi:MAG: AAA family ATPase [Bacilli bacterium]|jgi:guanylate kinase|nr:AAA family ATPase [Bacilli bacterium]
MIILTGASASGKTEIARLLAKKYGIVKAVTHTSRPPRKGERNGVDYFFVTKEEFRALKERGDFVETTVYNDNYYGTSKTQVTDLKCVVVDPNGLKSFIALKDPSVVTFYLLATEETRISRMRSRGDEPEDIERRIEGDRVDFRPACIAPTDFTIVTDEETLEELTDKIFIKYRRKLQERGLGAKGRIK